MLEIYNGRDLVVRQAITPEAIRDFVRGIVTRRKAIIEKVRFLDSQRELVKEVHFGGFTYNFDKYSLTKNNQDIHLTTKEHAVFRALARNLGEVVRHETLIEEAYKGESSEDKEDLIKKLIQKLRKKLGDTKDDKGSYNKYIRSFHGEGYMLVDSSSDASS